MPAHRRDRLATSDQFRRQKDVDLVDPLSVGQRPQDLASALDQNVRPSSCPEFLQQAGKVDPSVRVLGKPYDLDSGGLQDIHPIGRGGLTTHHHQRHLPGRLHEPGKELPEDSKIRGQCRIREGLLEESVGVSP